MSGLKEIKNRIRSVSSTHKLTSAMKLIATAKLKQSSSFVASIRDYENTLLDSINSAIMNISKENLNKIMEKLPWFLLNKKSDKPHVFLIFGANKGLCGNYNTSIIRETLNISATINQKSIFVPITHRTLEYFVKHEKENTKDLLKLSFSNNLNYLDLSTKIMKNIEDWFDNDEIGSVSIIRGKFVNALVQQVEHINLYPFSRKNFDLYTNDLSECKDTIIEPSEFDFLKSSMKSLIQITICRSFLESETCEYAAKMTMMEGAKRNAETLIDDLTLQYNRTRQSNITNELIEIIAGTNAMVEE